MLDVSIKKINAIVTNWQERNFKDSRKIIRGMTKAQLCELLTVPWQAGTDYIMWSSEKKVDFEEFIQHTLDWPHYEDN